MIPLSDECQARVDHLFSLYDRKEVERLLAEECGDKLPLYKVKAPEGYDRIRFAVLKLSRGKLDQLQKQIRSARRDWRDVLVSAGFANDPVEHKNWYPEGMARHE